MGIRAEAKSIYQALMCQYQSDLPLFKALAKGERILLAVIKSNLDHIIDNEKEKLMQTEKIKIEINQLELSEKILLVEDIWDSIAISHAEIPMSDWQKQTLDERYKAYKTGQLELHEGQSVYDGLREKHK